ncbi:MAG: hypothetical protein V1929_12035, partial [bacterium]
MTWVTVDGTTVYIPAFSHFQKEYHVAVARIIREARTIRRSAAVMDAAVPHPNGAATFAARYDTALHHVFACGR